MFRPPQYNNRQPPDWSGRNNQQLAELPNMNQVGSLIVNGARQFATRHRYVTAWYLLGLFVLCMLLITGGKGRSMTTQEIKEYNRIMDTVDVQAEYDAQEAYLVASNRYYATKGWFTCDSVCQRRKKEMKVAQQRWNAIRNEGNARMSDAKAVAGLFSNVGITEMTESFWQYMAAGKSFAKRQTGWDVMWMMMRGVTRGRDESWMEFALKVLLNIFINFSIGLVSALIFFILGLWNILRSYQPNPVVAVIVFIAAASAATSFVVTYILAMVGAAAGGIYGVAKLAEHSMRAQIADEQRRQRLQRPHHE